MHPLWLCAFRSSGFKVWGSVRRERGQIRNQCRDSALGMNIVPIPVNETMPLQALRTGPAVI